MKNHAKTAIAIWQTFQQAAFGKMILVAALTINTEFTVGSSEKLHVHQWTHFRWLWNFTRNTAEILSVEEIHIAAIKIKDREMYFFYKEIAFPAGK